KIASHARGKRHHSLAMALEKVPIDARHSSSESLDPSLAHEPNQVSIALLARREQHEMIRRRRRALALPSKRDVDLAAQDRLDRRGLACVIKLKRSEHVSMIGERYGRHAELRRASDNPFEPSRPIEHGKLGVHMEVNKRVCHYRTRT